MTTDWRPCELRRTLNTDHPCLCCGGTLRAGGRRGGRVGHATPGTDGDCALMVRASIGKAGSRRAYVCSGCVVARGGPSLRRMVAAWPAATMSQPFVAHPHWIDPSLDPFADPPAPAPAALGPNGKDAHA